ncbi:MAG: aldose 1-epimerase family protein [Pirellulales bacterium]|nr:aldose 1-epimerase family protein [Pirellulales bacterium]
MPFPNTVLLADDHPCRETIRVSAEHYPGTPPGWHVEKRRLQAGLAQGVDVVEVDTGQVRVVIVPTRGMGLWRAWFDEFELGWQSPVRGPVHPAFVPLSETSGWGWLDGFDELMCRCGLESLGAPDHDEQGQLRFGLHGRIANRPAHRVELAVDAEAGTLAVTGIVEETRFHHHKLRLSVTYTLRFDATEIAWRDEVENYGGTPTKMQMMYHVNVGLPLLGAGSQLSAPVKRVRPGSCASAGEAARNWATYEAPTPRYAQQVFYDTLQGDDAGDTLVLLTSSTGSHAVRLDYNVRQLPCFTQWKNSVAEADGYVTGLEPGTSFPNPRSVEEKAGRVLTLHPGERWQAELKLDLLSDPAAIAAAERRIAELQTGCDPIVDLETS